MPRFLNDNHGIVESIGDDTMKIALPRGGYIRAPKKEGVRAGQHVAFIMDTLDEEIIDVLIKEEADEIVKRGSNHLYDSACRNTPIEEEDDYGEGYAEHGDVFWCPELI